MRAALVVALGWTTACGGSGFDLGNVDIEDAPEAVRRSFCHFYAKCGLFPDEASCLASNSLPFDLDPSLVAAVRAGRVKYDGRKLGDCYEQFGNATCDRTDADGRHLLAGCDGAIAGTVGDGGACAVAAECISGVCNIVDCPDACCPGTCVGGTMPDLEAGLDEVCGGMVQCELGTSCSNNICVALVPAGSRCISSTECDYGLGCAGTPRTCRTLPLLGEPCAADTACRDEGQYCNTTTLVCTQVGLPGDACSAAARCSSFYECDPSAMQCARGAAVGEACTSTSQCFDFGTYCKADVCAPVEATGTACADDEACASAFCGPADTCAERPTCP